MIYATRIQRERIVNGEQMAGYGEELRLNRDHIQRYAPRDAIILHPLPRDSRTGAFDLGTDLDNLPQLAIFRQADNGVTMRMALFASVLGLTENLEDYFVKRRGFRPASPGRRLEK